jgi:hypothetical protein
MKCWHSRSPLAVLRQKKTSPLPRHATGYCTTVVPLYWANPQGAVYCYSYCVRCMTLELTATISTTEVRAEERGAFGDFSTVTLPLFAIHQLLWGIVRNALLNHSSTTLQPFLNSLHFIHLGGGSPVPKLLFLNELCLIFWTGRKMASNRAISMRNASTPREQLCFSSKPQHCVANFIADKGTQGFCDLFCCCWDIRLHVLLILSTCSTSCQAPTRNVGTHTIRSHFGIKSGASCT